MIHTRFKNLLIEHMASRQITVRDLSESTGISEKTIINMRGGNMDCRLSTVMIVADYLNLDLSELYPRTINSAPIPIVTVDDANDFARFVMSYKGIGKWKVVDDGVYIKKM